MTTPPAHPWLRRAVYASIALLMMIGTGIGFWPLIQADRQMARFCAHEAPGLTLAQLQASADALGYALSAPGPGQVLVDDPPALGRRQCLLRLDPQGRVAGP